MTKSNLERKEFISFHSTQAICHPRRKPARELLTRTRGMNWSRGNRGILLIDMLILVFCKHQVHLPWTGTAHRLLNISRAITNQEDNPEGSVGQSYGVNFACEVFSTQMTIVCVKLTKAKIVTKNGDWHSFI